MSVPGSQSSNRTKRIVPSGAAMVEIVAPSRSAMGRGTAMLPSRASTWRSAAS